MKWHSIIVLAYLVSLTYFQSNFLEVSAENSDASNNNSMSRLNNQPPTKANKTLQGKPSPQDDVEVLEFWLFGHDDDNCNCKFAAEEEECLKSCKTTLPGPIGANTSLPEWIESYKVSEKCESAWQLRTIAAKQGAEWALRMFDADGRQKSGVSSGATQMLGDFDGCNSVRATELVYEVGNNKTRTHDFNAKYFKSWFTFHPNTSSLGEIYWSIATCAPDACNSTDITFIRTVKYGLPILRTETPEVPQLKNHPEAVATIILLGVFVIVVIIATLLDYKRQRDAADRDISDDESAPLVSGHQKNKLEKAVLAFSLFRTLPAQTSAAIPPGTFGSINGIRFLSMCWIVLGHCYSSNKFYIKEGSWYIATEADNYKNLADIMDMAIIDRFAVAVDTFFVLSASLAAISFMKTLDRQGGNPTLKQVLLSYVHRYWRLTPVYLVCLMVWACLFQFWTSGPNLLNSLSDKDICAEDWWKHLLYVNNIFGHRFCFGWSWYLACDFQFFVFSPFVLTPLYKWPKIGIPLLAMCILGSWASGVVIQLFSYQGKVNGHLYFYIAPWARYASYGVGTALGYIMYKTECKIQMNKCTLLMGWLMCACLLVFPVFLKIDESNWIGSVLFDPTLHPCFGMGVAWIVFACSTGYAGMINTVLSWKFFVPLSRISYVSYLIHFMIIDFFILNAHQMMHVSHINMVLRAGGVMFYTVALSFIISLVFELPMLTLGKEFLPKPKKK